MGEITYVAGSTLQLNHELGQKVFEIVRDSSTLANERSRTYTDEVLEAIIERYKPERVWDMVDPLIASFFAFDGDRLVGAMFLSHKDYDDLQTGTGAYSSGLYVHPDYWKTGIAVTLFDKINESAKELGIVTIRGHSTAFPGTLKFYRNRGAKVGGEKIGDLTPDIRVEYHDTEIVVK
jgi:GNAT superfamily N-acetyltransferase|tara:strand:+ start:146 stop:679 length:534 start_codon:yes stop_codon:yes gene_type:complete